MDIRVKVAGWQETKSFDAARNCRRNWAGQKERNNHRAGLPGKFHRAFDRGCKEEPDVAQFHVISMTYKITCRLGSDLKEKNRIHRSKLICFFIKSTLTFDFLKFPFNFYFELGRTLESWHYRFFFLGLLGCMQMHDMNRWKWVT